MQRIETDPVGRRLASRVLSLPSTARQAFCASVCEKALRRTGVTDPLLFTAVAELRSGSVPAARPGAVRAMVADLDRQAWTYAEHAESETGDIRAQRYEAEHLTAFRRARAAAAVSHALGGGAVEAAYEAHHAGLSLREIEELTSA